MQLALACAFSKHNVPEVECLGIDIDFGGPRDIEPNDQGVPRALEVFLKLAIEWAFVAMNQPIFWHKVVLYLQRQRVVDHPAC
jgi:hypothetical protein